MSGIKVECPCGATFERPIQRGRPAVWCEKCRTLPPAQRAARPQSEDGESASTPTVSRFGEHDDLSYAQREAVEAKVSEMYEKFKTEIWPNRAKLFRSANKERAAQAWQQEELMRIYRETGHPKWQRGIGAPEE